jgi:large subunit ribosomal protein L20
MRVKRGKIRAQKHKKVLKQAKGFRGGFGRLYRTTHEAVTRAMAYSYRDRRSKKRDFRKLWTLRINAAARPLGLSYSRLISGLKKQNIQLDRKILADLAVNDNEAFTKVASFVQK